MSDKTPKIVEELSASIDIPESAYEKAEVRYKDLGEWFGRPESKCAEFDPHIYPQGSFRLGTVVRSDEYDLDFGCRLRNGISKATHTQKQLKALVGADMEAYRKARQIQNSLEEKNRCWRLPYSDEIYFHMDGVPSIPAEESQRRMLTTAIMNRGANKLLAENVASFAGSITDKRLPNYESISSDWRISNSEGFARWFESRMKLAVKLLLNRAVEAKAAKVDDLPARRWNSPLQKCVQILKCHRNVMFADNPDAKPISAIITTLAAESYQGEQDIQSAIENILVKMSDFVRATVPRVPNPVHPSEDFADKWYDPAYAHLQLEKNFWLWLEQARNDFRVLQRSHDADFIVAQARTKFGAVLNAKNLKEKLGLGSVSIITPPKSHIITATPAKPWMQI
jgi:hypothetical protein